MELNELKAIMAASILGGRIAGTQVGLDKTSDGQIQKAVEISQKVWEEVLRQENQ